MYDIVALGELLIDFATVSTDNEGYPTLEAHPGGAPANVLVAAQKLGKKTAIISKVGNDIFGRLLKNTIEKEKVNTESLIISDEYPTTLAFVTLSDNGDRSFEFFRKKSADVMLNSNEVDDDILKNCRVFHFGSVSMTTDPSRTATFDSVMKAKSYGACISYDPNYRPPLWDSEENAVKYMLEGLKYADVVKVADNEIELLTGEKDYMKGAERILDYGAQFVFVTCGPEGCYYSTANGITGLVPGFKVNTIDTTGAGDTFTGAVLSKLLDYEFTVTPDELHDTVKFANAAGALNTTKYGAIPAMPTLSEILDLMNNN